VTHDVTCDAVHCLKRCTVLNDYFSVSSRPSIIDIKAVFMKLCQEIRGPCFIETRCRSRWFGRVERNKKVILTGWNVVWHWKLKELDTGDAQRRLDEIVL